MGGPTGLGSCGEKEWVQTVVSAGGTFKHVLASGHGHACSPLLPHCGHLCLLPMVRTHLTGQRFPGRCGPLLGWWVVHTQMGQMSRGCHILSMSHAHGCYTRTQMCTLIGRAGLLGCSGGQRPAVHVLAACCRRALVLRAHRVATQSSFDRVG